MSSIQNRLQKVLRFIEVSLDETLSVEELSKVAGISRFHFHRQFSACMGISMKRYIQQLRLHKAAYLLAFRKHKSVLEIALDCGFESGEAFARAFKKQYQLTPSHFRDETDWETLTNDTPFSSTVRSIPMNNQNELPKVNVVERDAIETFVMVHRGSPNKIMQTLQQFIAWRKKAGLSPDRHATFNFLYDDPEAVSEEKFRMDIAVAANKSSVTLPQNMKAIQIPAGRYAQIQHRGDENSLRENVRYLYRNWLLQGDEEAGDFPLVFHRRSVFPDVDPSSVETDIYLLLK